LCSDLPFIGLVLERYFPPKMATGIAVAVLAYGLVFANTNNVRALLPLRHRFSAYQPRPLSYFADQHLNGAETYTAAGRMVDQLRCRYVGIDAYLPDPALSTLRPRFGSIHCSHCLMAMGGNEHCGMLVFTTKPRNIVRNNLTPRLVPSFALIAPTFPRNGANIATLPPSLRYSAISQSLVKKRQIRNRGIEKVSDAESVLFNRFGTSFR
jgi:hypothetical protein